MILSKDKLKVKVNSHQEEDRVEEGDGKQSVEVDVPWEESNFCSILNEIDVPLRKITSPVYDLSIYVHFFRCA